MRVRDPMVLGVKMVAVVCMRVSARSSLAFRAAPSASPIMSPMPELPRVGLLKLSVSLLPWPICPEKAGARPKSGKLEVAWASRMYWRR